MSVDIQAEWIISRQIRTQTKRAASNTSLLNTTRNIHYRYMSMSVSYYHYAAASAHTYSHIYVYRYSLSLGAFS